jgi:hypothetical protein
MIDAVSRISKAARRSIAATPNAVHSLFMPPPTAPSFNEFSRLHKRAVRAAASRSQRPLSRLQTPQKKEN